MQPENEHDETPMFCSRCARELRPGKGNFYVVNIEAIADPTPPSISVKELSQDLGREIRRILEQMRDLSEREALDQVYRRLTLFLCTRCYEQWIEDPTG